MRYRSLLPFLLFLLTAFMVSGQSESGGDVGGEGSLPAVPSSRIVPVFPDTNAGFIHIEGESAVSTNFDKEPTLNYGVSNYRALQLNRYTGLYGGAAFYAEYVFYLEEGGRFEFWYGGTPPGPREDLDPSYSSPFSYRIDDGEPTKVYREDVHVVERYVPAYYWSRVGTIELEPGVHKLRFEVTEKRRYDGKYYFFLDGFFLLEEGTSVGDFDPPRIFPADMTDRSIDRPFATMNDYEWLISQEPDAPEPYIELALVYSLLSDYLSALKYLNRASLTAPDDPFPLLLIAKNRLWKGDVNESLAAYQRVLEKDPDSRDIWNEAGKVAAWSGKYREAESIFLRGLEKFPGDLNLTVNLGLTYLWALRGGEGRRILDGASDIAEGNLGLRKELAEIYIANGYPDLAVTTYLKAIEEFPDHLELYLLLEQAYELVDRMDDAEKLYGVIEATFVPSDRLSGVLESFKIRQGLRKRVIDDYLADLAARPDNLELRELLVQTYFWNGLRKDAIEEYFNILANQAFRAFKEFDRTSSEAMGLIDSFAVYGDYYARFPAYLKQTGDDLTSELSVYREAVKAHRKYLDDLEKAKEARDTGSVARSGETADAVARSEERIARIIAGYGAASKLYTSLSKQFELAASAVVQLRERESQDQKAFGELTGSKGWRWDRAAFMAELEGIAAGGLTLADYILARVYQIEGRFEDAREHLDRLATADEKEPAYEYAAVQQRLWQGSVGEAFTLLESSKPILEKYIPASASLFGLITEARGVSDVPAAFLATEAEEAAASALEEMAELSKGAQELSAASRNFHEAVRSILINRMVRIIYFHQEDTHLIRFQLGEYYLADGDRTNAIRMFDQVLDIDPWNTDAIYKLGTVYELDGEWYRAMKLYRQVYDADPLFENVTALHNNLARNHADSLFFAGQTLIDTSRIRYRGNGSFSTSLSSTVSLDLGYAVDAERLYGAVSVNDVAYQLHDFELSLPVRPGGTNLRISPILGAVVSSTYFGDVASGSVQPRDFAGSLTAEPRLGIDLSVSLGPLYTALTYRYGRVRETFASEADRTLGHAADLNLSLPFSFLDVPFLALSSMRTYGKADYRTTVNGGAENLILTAAQELVFGIHLFDTPWTNLLFTANAIYEHSRDPSVVEYFAPEDVLTIKGGIQASTWIGIGGGNVLGVTIRGGAGRYAERILDEAPPLPMLQAEGGLGLELTKGYSAYYLNAAASATFTGFPVTDYWSFVIDIGHRVSLPKLLTD